MDIMHMICEAFTDSEFRPKANEPEYMESMNAYTENMDALFRSLTSEQKPLFFELEAQRNLIGAMDEDRMFIFGFQIGAKLMLNLMYPQTPNHPI